MRVHDLAPKSLWGERYDHINDFEELLAEDGTIVGSERNRGRSAWANGQSWAREPGNRAL
ncbi:hypothetical protein [Sorangium sp. So ce861]|uniref:hypothetical protein n=1 Tax=Sorangium sp. So ce861 TaxID=3133323 RepID=UPI003F5FBDBD